MGSSLSVEITIFNECLPQITADVLNEIIMFHFNVQLNLWSKTTVKCGAKKHENDFRHHFRSHFM